MYSERGEKAAAGSGDPPGSRRAVRLGDSGCHGAVWGACPAAACTARLDLSGGVGHIVRLDGHFFLSDPYCPGAAPAPCQSHVLVLWTAGGKFLLERAVFQFTGLSGGIYLALPAVGMGAGDDPWVLADPPDGRAFAAALSGVDHLCRISELRCMVSESIKTASRGFHGTLSVYCGIM